MLSLFRCARSGARFSSQVPRLSLLQEKISTCGFHTTSPRALPIVFIILKPVFFIILKPVFQVVAFIAGRNVIRIGAFAGGRNFRSWWRALPKSKRENYWCKIQEKKWKIAGGGVVASAMAHWFYISHLEIEPITGRERFSILSPKKVQELSHLEFKAICAQFANCIIPDNHPYCARVKHVTDLLLNANKHMPQIYTKTWTITVLDDQNNMNAFVLPTGDIFIFTGMLNICSTDDELAMVLGHEISHAILFHAGETLSREHLLESIKLVLITLASAIIPSDILSLLGFGVGAGAVNATLRYPYSREMENEADKVGIHLAAKACFDVRAAVALWAKMEVISQLDDSESLELRIEWLSTHPSEKTRQVKIEEQLPDAINFRKYCECPDLPVRDPRNEVEIFRQFLILELSKIKKKIPKTTKNITPVSTP